MDRLISRDCRSVPSWCYQRVSGALDVSKQSQHPIFPRTGTMQTVCILIASLVDAHESR